MSRRESNPHKSAQSTASATPKKIGRNSLRYKNHRLPTCHRISPTCLQHPARYDSLSVTNNSSQRCFTPLLISFPYSSTHVTSRDGCSLIFTKTFYIMLRFTRIVQHGSSFFGSIFQHLQGAPYLHSLPQAALCTNC